MPLKGTHIPGQAVWHGPRLSSRVDRLQHRNQTHGELGHSYSPLTLVVQVAPRALGLPLVLEGLPDPTRKMRQETQS